MDLKGHLLRDEMLASDQGYPDPQCSRFKLSGCTVNFRFISSTQEAKNKRLKQFDGFSCRFRPNLDLNSTCFFIVVSLVQISFENGERIFFDE